MLLEGNEPLGDHVLPNAQKHLLTAVKTWESL